MMILCLRYLSIMSCVAVMLIAVAPASPAAQEQPALARLLGSTHVHGLAVDRSDPGRLLIATHHGLHAARIHDGTVSAVSDHRDDLMGFTPHPSDRAVLYASGHPSHGGNLGVIASRDGGRTWSPLSPGVGGPVDFHQMDVSKADPRIIYGVHGGLQVSDDGGLSWRRLGAAPEGLIDLAASARSVDTLFAGTREGLLVSRDGGHTWQPGHVLRRPTTTVEATAQGHVFAFIIGQGLLRADDPALNWSTISRNFGDRYLLHLTADPDNPSRLFAATQHNEIMASRDGGLTWHVIGAPRRIAPSGMPK